MACEDTDAQGEHHAKMEAKIGLMHMQAREHLRPLRLEEARKDGPLEASEEA